MATNKEAPTKQNNGNDNVIICCSHPQGLVIHLDNTQELRDVAAQNTDTGNVAYEASYVLAGAKESPLFKESGGTRLLGAIGKTSIPRAFWEEWKKQHFNDPLLKSGRIFEAKSSNDADAMIAERKNERTGMEGINPSTNLQGGKVTSAS